MKVLLFGTGEYYNRYKCWFNQCDIVALIDNAADKQGAVIDGHPVISPTDTVALEYDEIFVLSFYITQMREQLVELGVPKEKIHHFYDICEYIDVETVCREVQVFGEIPRDKSNTTLLLNQDLVLGGPALALLQVARVLKSQGREVVYGSMIDGPLKEELIELGIPVVVDENMLVSTMNECRWTHEYSQIICNTINFHVFLSDRPINVPMVWWLHDALFFYEGINRQAMEAIDNANLNIWAVGPVATKAINAYRPDFEVENLLYGVKDSVGHYVDKPRNSTISITTIGYVENRKGQDVLVNALLNLSTIEIEKIKVKFVGRNTSLLAQELVTRTHDISQIEFVGLVDRVEIDNILAETDVVICPSREDPMPTVCAEAMMHSIPCIVSDMTGTADYIASDINGFVFEGENVSELTELLRNVICNTEVLSQMRVNARKTYEDIFSMEAFEKRLNELIDRLSL